MWTVAANLRRDTDHHGACPLASSKTDKGVDAMNTKYLAILLVATMFLLAATILLTGCQDGTSNSPGINSVQTLVDQQILKGNE